MAEKNVAGSGSGDNRTRDGVSEGLLFHPLKPADWPEAMTGMGHEDQFPAPRRSSVGSRFSKRTLVGALGNGRDAPITGRSSDEGNRRGWPIAVICRPTLIVSINNLWWPVLITV